MVAQRCSGCPLADSFFGCSSSACALACRPSLLQVILFTYHLAAEMLWRAVVLVGVTGWATDLLYAAGLDDWLYLQGGVWQEATPQVGGE